MNYAKMTNGVIQFSPNPIRIGEHWVGNPTPDMLIADGYKPVTYTDPPTVGPGFIAVPGWEEQAEAIVQIWTVEEEPDEVDADRAMEILFGGDE